jgi:hypothetical protein
MPELILACASGIVISLIIVAIGFAITYYSIRENRSSHKHFQKSLTARIDKSFDRLDIRLKELGARIEGLGGQFDQIERIDDQRLRIVERRLGIGTDATNF